RAPRLGRIEIAARQAGRALALSVLVAIACAPASAAAPSRITFYFGLKRPESKARTAFFAVQRPGSSTYRRFLTPRQIAARYGASAATKGAFVREVKRLGLSPKVDSSGVFARVTGTVSRFESVFKVKIEKQFGNFPNVNTYFPKGHVALRLPAVIR